MTENRERCLPGDRVFRRFVVGATALALGAILGSAAALRRTGPDGVGFAWSWAVLAWGAGAAACAWPFWHLVWAVQENPTRRTKILLVCWCAVLLVLGLGAFLYPIRFISPTYRNDVLVGLVVAVFVLAAGAGMLYGLARAFTRDESESERR